MDSGDQDRRRSKRRFIPKRPKPSNRPIVINTEEAEAEEDNKRAARQLAKRIGIGRSKAKTETKASSSEVVFQSDSSFAIRLFGVRKEDDKDDSDVNPSSSADIPLPVSSATAQEDEEDVDNLVTRTVDNYVEPWDYKNSYYPIVLPWREPNSGDPELLDQEEFGDVAKHGEYDENSINSAEELGLTSVQHCKKQVLVFKLPHCLPVTKQPTGTNTKKPVPGCSSERGNPFEGLQGGFMGKMLVYKSGKIKMKLGDVLFDVEKQPDPKIPNDVAAINVEGEEGNFSRIGSSPKFVTVVPDIDSILETAMEKETHK